MLARAASIVRFKKLTAGACSDLLECVKVHALFTAGVRVTNTDGEHLNLAGGCNGRCIQRCHFAGGIVAIGQQNEQALFNFTGLKAVDSEPLSHHR